MLTVGLRTNEREYPWRDQRLKDQKNGAWNNDQEQLLAHAEHSKQRSSVEGEFQHLANKD
jgi:hypothetical protein